MWTHKFFFYLDKMKNNRLLALDIFRGMTIFFMIIVNTPGSWSYVYAPLRHAPWDGCTPTDLVFPFFVFIVGVSMSYSFMRFDKENRKEWVLKILKRTALIFLIGLLLNWFPFYDKSISDLRIFGVLQRIALAFGGAALLVVLFNRKYIEYLILILLAGYFFILMVFGGDDPLSLEGNLVRKIDLALVGENHIYGGYGVPFDPEGLLSTIPSIATVLIGYLTGRFLQGMRSLKLKLRWLVPAGFLLLVVSKFMHYGGIPINKPIWSSSYVFFTGGLAILLLSALLWILDTKEWDGKWTFPFKVFGLNPLISYVMSSLIVKTILKIKVGDSNLYNWLYTNIFQSTLGDYPGSLAFAFSVVGTVFIFSYLLYKNDKIIKV